MASMRSMAGFIMLASYILLRERVTAIQILEKILCRIGAGVVVLRCDPGALRTLPIAQREVVMIAAVILCASVRCCCDGSRMSTSVLQFFCGAQRVVEGKILRLGQGDDPYARIASLEISCNRLNNYVFMRHM